MLTDPETILKEVLWEYYRQLQFLDERRAKLLERIQVLETKYRQQNPRKTLWIISPWPGDA